MKRIELIRHLERHGVQFLREGGNHSVYVNRAAGKTSLHGAPSSGDQRISRAEDLQRFGCAQAMIPMITDRD